MENKDIMLMGFSNRARDPAFREEIITIRKKEKTRDTIKMCIYLAVLVIAVGVIIFFASDQTDKLSESAVTAFAWITVVAFAALPIILVLSIIRIMCVIGDTRNLNNLNKDSIDGVITLRQEWETLVLLMTRIMCFIGDALNLKSLNKESINIRTNHRIVIRTDEGKKFDAAHSETYMPYVREGDRVRYHPGFPYPLEIYDKSKHQRNICVFCGEVNNAQRHNCEKCGKPMLI